MRVTERMIFQGASTRTARASERAAEATEQMSSGMRVVHPGDDPLAAGSIVTTRLDLTRLKSLEDSAERAADELGTADGALDNVSTALARARELAVQLGNDTYNATQRSAAVDEVKSLQKTIIAAMNTEVAGRYIFGGFKDGAPPFDASGAYLGDDGVRKLQVAPGVTQDTSVRADVALKGANGGTDVLASLDALATALASNDVTGVRAALDPLDAGINQVSNARASVGAAMSGLDAAAFGARALSVSQQGTLSDLEEVDTIEAASRLAFSQRALDAALTASAQSFRLTLLDKLK